MKITASIVSHGHDDCLRALLRQLAALAEPRLQRVIVTLNRPEDRSAPALHGMAAPFALQLVENAQPRGFAVNHNHAFGLDGQIAGGSPLFAVLNPDLQLQGNPLAELSQLMEAEPRVGLAYPRQLDEQGRLQDHERRVPTPARLLRRHVLRQRQELRAGERPEWVNGAFLLLRREAFAQLGGFDPGYRMYCEDVDLCLRLQLAGWSMAAGELSVEHQAQRASHRRLRHLSWHVQSLWRLWTSPVWRQWRSRHAGRDKAPVTQRD